MKKHVVKVSKKERKLLKKIYKKSKGKESHRAFIILLSVSFIVRTVAEIAAICQCSRQSVYNAINTFKEYGIAGLYDKPRSGRPLKIPQEHNEKILGIVENKTPQEVGKYLHSKWTLRTIQQYLREKFTINVAQSTILRWLHRNDWTYHRSKLELRQPGGLELQERDKVVQLLQKLDSEKEVILFMDQSAFYVSGRPSGTWMPKGKQKTVPVNGDKQKFWIFGVINPHNQKFYYRICKECNSEQTILFLRQILQLFPDKIIHLVLDRASFHTSEETQQFFADHPEFAQHKLPVRASKLNPIERFWLFAKNIISASYSYLNMDELYHILRRFFWHYNQGNNPEIQYNFSLQNLVNLWNKWHIAA